MIVVGWKILHFINNEDQEALGYKTQWYTSAIALTEKIKLLVYVSVCDDSQNKLYICLEL